MSPAEKSQRATLRRWPRLVRRSARPAGSADADAALLRATARRLGLQAALVVAVAVLALAGVASLVVLRGQSRAADALLRDAVSRADDVSDPPTGSWLVIRGPDGQQASPGLPPGLPDASAINRVLAGDGAVVEDVQVGRSEYRVRTERRGSGAVQAVLDLRAEHDERGRLLAALLSMGALGLMAAAGVGALLGRRAVRPLSNALALQRSFVADASHELRTPLTLLSTRAQLLRQSLQEGSANAGALVDANGLVADSRRLAEVVDDLLLAADPSQPEQLRPVDVSELCSQIIDSAGAYAAERGVGLAVAVPANPVRVLGSAAALRRALMAIVDNGLEHTPAGGQVSLEVSVERRRVSLTVRDTGVGMAAGMGKMAFTRFHSGAQTSGRRRYGLGLALARDVALRHRGSISSGPVDIGTGTAVTIRLPLAR